MIVKFINCLGLVLDIAGALLMFYYTPFTPAAPDTTRHEIEVFADWKYYGKKQEQKEKLMIKIGLIVMMFGFALQLLASIL